MKKSFGNHSKVLSTCTCFRFTLTVRVVCLAYRVNPKPHPTPLRQVKDGDDKFLSHYLKLVLMKN